MANDACSTAVQHFEKWTPRSMRRDDMGRVLCKVFSYRHRDLLVGPGSTVRSGKPHRFPALFEPPHLLADAERWKRQEADEPV